MPKKAKPTIEEEVDLMREENTKAIEALNAAGPRKRYTTLTDWQDRLLGRNGKLSIADIESIYGPQTKRDPK